MQHLRWEKSGRIFQNELAPNQFLWQGGVGEEQVEDLGNYYPHLYVPTNGVLRYADSSIEFQNDQQIIKRAGNTLASSSMIIVQREISAGNWQTIDHGSAVRDMHVDEVFRNGAWQNADGKCTGFLSFPNAPYDFYVGIEVGRNAKTRMGFRFRAAQTGRVRFVLVNDGIEKIDAGDYEWIQGRGIRTDPLKNVGIRFKNIKWRWSYEEADQRQFQIVNNPDGSRKLNVVFGPFDYTANTWLEVSPDTWSATGIAAEPDDGDEMVAGTWNANGNYANTNLYLESAGGAACKWIGLRWVPTLTGTITSIDAGTQIVLTNAGDNGNSTTVGFNLRASNTQTPAVWSTTKPSAVAAWTTANRTGNGSTGNQTLDVSNIVGELAVTDGYSYSAGTNYINFGFLCTAGTAGSTWWSATHDYDGVGGDTEATLAIVYTVAAGGDPHQYYLGPAGTYTRQL